MINLSINYIMILQEKITEFLFDFQVGAPQYLSVPSFRDCLGDHPALTGSYSELCVPAGKPQNCPEESWKSIQDPQVFSGVRCALNNRNGFGAPEYLSIRNFQDCLGTKNTQWCLPVQKPNLCLQESWMRLQSKFEGKPCSSLEVSITNEDGKAQLIMITIRKKYSPFEILFF